MEQVFPLSKREKAANELAEAAYVEIERKYGKHGVEPKSYHNSEHGRDVVTDGLAIVYKAIEAGRLKLEDRALVIIAGAYHDIEKSHTSGINERDSASQAVFGMRESGQFTEEEMDRVSAAILATIVYFDEEGRMQQSAGEDYITQVLADADLANLGYPIERFWQKSLALFNEDHQDGTGMDKFITFQKELLTYHKFYTPEATVLFPGQPDNLVFTEQYLLTSSV